MKLSELKSKGGFVAGAPVAKEVTWKRKGDAGEDVEDTFTVHIIKQSFGTIEAIWSGKDDKSSKAADYIAQSVRLGDDGKERMSYQDAYQLDPGLAAVLIAAVNEVNGASKADSKN